MALFRTKKKDSLGDKGTSNALTSNVLPNKQINNQNLEEIVKTTDSMNFVSQQLESTNKDKNGRILAATHDAISRNYDLARRRITSTYQDIVDSGNYVGTPFLSVQLTLSHYDKGWNVRHVEQTLNTFMRGIIDSLATGTGVALSNELVFESVVYINKILPTSKQTPSFAELVNTYTWKQLFNQLVEKHQLSTADYEIIEYFIEALDINVKQGYYVQMLDLIVARIRVNEPYTIVLFSYDTLRKLNEIYLHTRNSKNKVQVSRTNTIDHFTRAESELAKKKAELEALEAAREKAAQTYDDDNFVPADDKGMKAQTPTVLDGANAEAAPVPVAKTPEELAKEAEAKAAEAAVEAQRERANAEAEEKERLERELQELKVAKEAAESKAKEDELKKAEAVKAKAEAQAAEEKAAAEKAKAQAAEEKAKADAKIAEAKSETEKAKAVADAEAAKAKAEADAEKAKLKAEADARAAEEKAKADEIKAKEAEEKAKLKAEADAKAAEEKAKLKEEHDKAKAQAAEEKAKAKAQAAEEKAKLKEEKAKAKAQAAEEKAKLKAQAAEEKAKAKAEAAEAKAKADAEKKRLAEIEAAGANAQNAKAHEAEIEAEIQRAKELLAKSEEEKAKAHAEAVAAEEAAKKVQGEE